MFRLPIAEGCTELPGEAARRQVGQRSARRSKSWRARWATTFTRAESQRQRQTDRRPTKQRTTKKSRTVYSWRLCLGFYCLLHLLHLLHLLKYIHRVESVERALATKVQTALGAGKAKEAQAARSPPRKPPLERKEKDTGKNSIADAWNRFKAFTHTHTHQKIMEIVSRFVNVCHEFQPLLAELGEFLRMGLLKLSQSGVARSVGPPCLGTWKSAQSAERGSQSWIYDLCKCGMYHQMWRRRRCSGVLVVDNFSA